MSSMRYSGKALKELAKIKGAKVTRTQTAARAVANIRKKYIVLKETGTYYHRGNGNWALYSMERDLKTSSKLQNTAKAKKKYGARVKTIRDARGKVISKIRGSSSHKADTVSVVRAKGRKGTL